MKLLHLGDLHLGKTLAEFVLIEDQKYILEQVMDIIKDQAVDGVLIAGDVYDKSIPSEQATVLLDCFLKDLSESGAKTFMISGNHDSDERLNFGSSLFESNQIFISSIYDGALHKYTVEDDCGEVDIYLMPFVKASQVRAFFPNEKIHTYEDAVRVIISNAGINRERRNVLVAHQFVAGRFEDPKLGGSESAGTQTVGLVEKIGFDCFEDFDYVALGHIHSPQKVGRDTIRYSGSILKYSTSEVNNEKSVPIITLGKKGEVDIEIVPLRPMRNMRHIKGKLKDLLDKKNVEGQDDFIYATLTDEDVVNDAMGILRATYPNTIRIDYDNAHTKELEQVDISKIAENKSFSELVGDFYRLVYGRDISEEEMDVMREVAREAGVINEAD